MTVSGLLLGGTGGLDGFEGMLAPVVRGGTVLPVLSRGPGATGCTLR